MHQRTALITPAQKRGLDSGGRPLSGGAQDLHTGAAPVQTFHHCRRAEIAYRFDGSFDGLLCCVFESFEKKRRPVDIQSEQAQVQLLFPVLDIASDAQRAARVLRGAEKSLGQDALALAQLGMLTCHPQKALLAHDFLCMGFEMGPKVIHYLADDTVSALHKAVRHLQNEAHLLNGFVRFSAYGPLLAAQISPKNQVLSLLEAHFCDRFQSETFIIHDRTHRQALVYRPGESRIVDVEGFVLPPPDAQEAMMRRLWKRFYETVAIQGRENPRCRMGHMPKRYWKHLTEFGLDEKPCGQTARPGLPGGPPLGAPAIDNPPARR